MKYLILCSLLIWGCHNASSNKQAPSGNETDTLQTQKNIEGQLLFDNDTIAIYRIDSVSYFEQRQKFYVEQDTIPYIADFEQAKKILQGKVVFGGWNDGQRIIDSLLDGQMISMVRFDNGDIFDQNLQKGIFSDVYFVKYYPTEDIVLFEGGHTSDFSINLKNGLMDVEQVGNPDYIVHSPNKHYRLNGWFPGQECSSYFIQKQVEGEYVFCTGIPIHLTKEAFDLCTIDDIFWKSDQELYFRNKYYGSTDDERLGFFKLTVK